VHGRRNLLGLAVASLLFAQCAPQCAPAPPTSAGEAWARFDRDLSGRILGSGQSSAMSVAVSKDGRVVHEAAFGTRVPGTGEQTETTDRYRIASISKVLTSIVVLQLVEQGRLQLDQSVGWTIAGYVGASPTDPRIAGITVRRLLSHTAGLGVGETLTFGAVVPSCPAAAQRLLSAALSYVPGTGYVYANLGFCLLGLLVEQVTGRPYTDVVQDLLLLPLGISDMAIGPTYGTAPNDVWHWTRANADYMEVLWSAGAWLATPADLVRILDSLDPSRPGFHPLSAATAASVCQSSGFPDNPNAYYGLGMICWYGGEWGHTGTLESAHAVVVHRTDGVTWSVLVSGNSPRETDDVINIYADVFSTSGVRPFLP
jgi:D-alanyl-D-alanine carboxypeptidase